MAAAISHCASPRDNLLGLRAYFADLLRAFRAPAAPLEVRVKTARALQAISGIPGKEPNDPSPLEKAAWLKAWEAWIIQNPPQAAP